MPLIKCPDCGRQVSSLADVCPNCGYPFAKLREEAARKEESRKRAEFLANPPKPRCEACQYYSKILEWDSCREDYVDAGYGCRKHESSSGAYMNGTPTSPYSSCSDYVWDEYTK